MTEFAVFGGGSSVSVLLEETVNWSFDPALSVLSNKKQRRRVVSELKCKMNFPIVKLRYFLLIKMVMVISRVISQGI